jgi:hypothetical protein
MKKRVLPRRESPGAAASERRWPGAPFRLPYRADERRFPMEACLPAFHGRFRPGGRPRRPRRRRPSEDARPRSTPETAGADPSAATFYEPPEPSASPSAAPGFATAAPAGAPARTATVTPAVAPTTFPTPSAPTSTDGGGFYSESLKADEMFGLVNQARAAAGLPAYTWDATLVPRHDHCRDMPEITFSPTRRPHGADFRHALPRRVSALRSWAKTWPMSPGTRGRPPSPMNC